MILDQASEQQMATLTRGTAKAFSGAWFGGQRLSTGVLPTDRLFTGQTRDLGDDRFYFFKSRYYDATIGKFHSPDSIVPGAGNPQGLNRYAYVLNNPLRYTDPSGHDPWDPNWEANFQQQNHRPPTQQDWNNYQFSLSHPGSGPGGSWTQDDWSAYNAIQQGQGFYLDRSGTYLALTQPPAERLDEKASWWMYLLDLAPQPHAGSLDASLAVTRVGVGEGVRISLYARPSDPGVLFDPQYAIPVRLPSGRWEYVTGRLVRFRGAEIGPIDPAPGQLYTADVSIASGQVYGASVFANPAIANAIGGVGEIDLGFGPP